MSLLYTDGFDLQDYAMRYVSQVSSGTISILASGSTRFTAGSGMSFISSTSRYAELQRAVTPSAQVYIGAAVNTNGNPGGIIGFLTDGGSSSQCYIYFNSVQGITAYRGAVFTNGLGTSLGLSAAGVVPVGWCYVEVSATISTTTGSIAVRINGTPVLSLTNQNTKATGTSTNIDSFAFGSLSSGTTTSFDDMYVCNSLGTTNNTFLGDVRVQTLMPNGAGSSTQFTPTGSANNYANVNDIPDSTSTYNSSSTTGQRDTYAMGDLAGGTSAIYGIQQVTHAFKTTAGTANLKAAQQSGATVSYGATQSLGTTNSPYLDVFETNPATSNPYTTSEVNGLESGAEVA